MRKWTNKNTNQESPKRGPNQRLVKQGPKQGQTAPFKITQQNWVGWPSLLHAGQRDPFPSLDAERCVSQCIRHKQKILFSFWTTEFSKSLKKFYFFSQTPYEHSSECSRKNQKTAALPRFRRYRRRPPPSTGDSLPRTHPPSPDSKPFLPSIRISNYFYQNQNHEG